MTLNDNEFLAAMKVIILALKEAGYDPREQLRGYIETGNVSFITRHGNARKLIQTLDTDQLQAYVSQMTNLQQAREERR